MLGAGFAGISVAWHLLKVLNLSSLSPKLTSFFWIVTNKQMFFSSFFLLQDCPKELSLSVDVYDEVGIGGGASGVSGGLLHPYSPKG